MEAEASQPRKDTTTCSTDLIEFVQHMIREHGEDYKVRDDPASSRKPAGAPCVTAVLGLVTGHGARREELLSRHTQTNQEEGGLIQALSRRRARRLPRCAAASDVVLRETYPLWWRSEPDCRRFRIVYIMYFIG